MYASAPLHIPAQEREGDEDEGQDQLDIDNGEMSSLQAPIEPPPSPSPALVRKSSRGRGAPKKTLKQRMLRLKDPYLKIFMVQNEDGSTHEVLLFLLGFYLPSRKLAAQVASMSLVGLWI